MFENEIKSIYDYNLKKVKNLSNHINFEQLISANLHPAILQYISAEIDFLIFEDRQKLLKNSVFDYSSEKIQQYFASINKELKKNKKFSQEYITKLILHAVSFNVNYLVRPKWALIKFLFDKTQEKSAEEVKQILNYVYFYVYLRKILTLYIEKKKIVTLTKGDFEDLLAKIDESGLDSNKDAIIDKALESMSEFINVGTPNKSSVPISAVKLFLEEKNLLTQLNRLEKHYSNKDKGSYEISEIHDALKEPQVHMDEESEKIIKELVEQETGFVSPDEEKSDGDDTIELQENTPDVNAKTEEQTEKELDQEKPGESEKNIENSETEQKNIIDIEADDEQPIMVGSANDNADAGGDKSGNELVLDEESIQNKSGESGAAPESNEEFTLGDDEDMPADESDKSAETEDNELEISDDSNEIQFEPEEIDMKDKPDEKLVEKHSDSKQLESSEKNKMDDETLSGIVEEELESAATKIDMSSLLDNKKMTKIIEVVFDYDMEDFTTTIERISGCTSQDEAFVVIEKLFSTNRVNPKSKEAQTFKDLIAEYFD